MLNIIFILLHIQKCRISIGQAADPTADGPKKSISSFYRVPPISIQEYASTARIGRKLNSSSKHAPAHRYDLTHRNSSSNHKHSTSNQITISKALKMTQSKKQKRQLSIRRPFRKAEINNKISLISSTKCKIHLTQYKTLVG